MGLFPKQITAVPTSSDAKAAGSLGRGGQRRSVRSPMGGMIGERSAAHPPRSVPDHKTGLSARRLSCDPTATKPTGEPAATTGTVPPKAPAGRITGVHAPPLNDQAWIATVERSQPNRIALLPLLARLPNPKVRGRLVACEVQVTPPLVKSPRQTRGAPVTGLESTASSPSPRATTRPPPRVGGGSTATQLAPSAE